MTMPRLRAGRPVEANPWAVPGRTWCTIRRQATTGEPQYLNEVEDACSRDWSRPPT